MIKLAIFDLDGTLIDSTDELISALNFGLLQHGLSPQPSHEILMKISEGRENLINWAIAPNFHLAESVTKSCIKFYSDNFLGQTKMYSGWAIVLDSVNCPMVIHTNSVESFTVKALKTFGLDRWFNQIAATNRFRPKPYPDGSEALMKLFNVKPCHTIVVGDSLVDWQMAKTLGCHFAAATWGVTSKEIFRNEGVKPMNIMSDPEDLIKIIATA
jgi:phosphoglycolate phosphatase-like HAD superfamily hydrolase